ncbi:MAG: TolC family protein [Bdellovibrionales bacterium]|nr:TolC family protein [Bdellovibrionales bacterium]
MRQKNKLNKNNLSLILSWIKHKIKFNLNRFQNSLNGPTIFCINFLLFFTLCPNGQASTLDQVIQSELLHSNIIRAQENQARLAEGDRWRHFLMKEPNLQFSSSDSHNEVSYGVGGSFAFPGKTFAYMGWDRFKAQAEKNEILAKKMDLAKIITAYYLDCASQTLLVDLQKNAVSDLETLHKSLTVMYVSGHASQAERISTELQVRQSQAELRSTEDRAQAFCKQWERFHQENFPADPFENKLKDGIPEDLSEETIALLGNKTADESRAQTQYEQAQMTDQLRWWTIAPDINWSFSRNHYMSLAGSPTGELWTSSFSVSVTLPIFFPFQEAVDVRRIHAQATMDQHSAEIQKRMAQHDKREASLEFQRNKLRLKELHDKDLNLAEALAVSTFSAYKIGKLGFAELMMARKTLTELKTQEIQLKVATIQARLRCLTQCQVE